MKKVKAFHDVNPEPSLKDIPMLTSDEVEIKLDTILYRAVWNSGYGFEAKGTFDVEALRVFNVNNSNRIFRVRCARGCEEVFKVADGCSSPALFGKFTNATKEVHRMAKQDYLRCEKKKDKVFKTAELICSQIDKLKQFKESEVKLPKPLTV